MARDDAPIAGRVVDLEGRPVAGVSVKVMEVRLSIAGRTFGDEVSVKAFKALNAVRPVSDPYARSIQVAIAEQLDSSQKDLEDRKEWDTLRSPILPNRVASATTPAFIPDATTGPDGRFRITGIGRGRIATLQLDGPTIETTCFDVRTWPGAPIHLPAPRNPRSYAPWTVYGAMFEHVAGPTRAIEGIVRDRETGRPLADILVYGQRSCRAPGLDRPDDDRRPGSIPARRAAARARGQARGRPGLRLQRRPELVRDRSPAPGGSVPALLRVGSAGRDTTRQGAGPPRHRPEPGSPRHRPDHRQGHREARARARLVFRLRR